MNTIYPSKLRIGHPLDVRLTLRDLEGTTKRVDIIARDLADRWRNRIDDVNNTTPLATCFHPVYITIESFKPDYEINETFIVDRGNCGCPW
jgi:hypothetical protein